MTAQVAYADGSGEIRLRSLDSEEDRVLTGQWMMENPGVPQGRVLFRWPTWSPGGDRIAVEGLCVSNGGIDRALLWVVTADGVRAEAIEELPLTGLVYLQWRLDGAGLFRLTPVGNGELRLARAGSNTPLIEGAPLFLSGLPDGSVAVHVFAGDHDRGRLLLVSGSEGTVLPISDRPGGFRAPCVLPDGTVVFTVREEGGERVAIWNSSGDYEELDLAPGGRVALLGEIEGSVLIASGSAEEPEYRRLERLHGPPWCVERVSDRPFSAVFPLGGGRFALITAEESGAFSWRLLEEPAGGLRELLRFVPTEEETLRLGFFDQYRGSHSPVSPDGRGLVVAGVDVRASSLPAEPQVYYVPLEGPGSVRRLGPGRFAVWAPDPGPLLI